MSSEVTSWPRRWLAEYPHPRPRHLTNLILLGKQPPPKQKAMSGQPEHRFSSTSIARFVTAWQYPGIPAALALEAFSALRNWNLRLIQSALPSAAGKTMTHPERGTMTFQNRNRNHGRPRPESSRATAPHRRTDRLTDSSQTARSECSAVLQTGCRAGLLTRTSPGAPHLDSEMWENTNPTHLSKPTMILGAAP